MPYSISLESCYISPVCIDCAESAEVSVFSLKLGVRLAGLAGEAAEVSVLLVADDRLLYEAAFRIGRSQQPLLSFRAPAHILQTGVITAYLVVCGGDDGRISDIVDSGRVLVFPPEPAAEVRSLFERITRDVQQVFNNSSSASGSGPQQPLAQPQHQQQHPLLRRAWQSVATLLKPAAPQPQAPGPSAAPLSSSTTTGAAQQAGAGAQGAGGRGPRPDGCDAGAAGGPPSGPGLPDAPTLYAYEHFLIPFFRHWAAVFSADTSSALQAGASPCGPQALPALAVRLLHFLLDNEMWAAGVLLLGKFPDVLEQVLQDGLELPGEFCDPIILERLRAALPLHADHLMQPLHTQPRDAVAPQPPSLQQLCARFDPFSTVPLADGATLLDNSAGSSPFSQDESSFESATEILRRLGMLQHQRGEQEAAEQDAYLQLPHLGQRQQSAASSAASSDPAAAAAPATPPPAAEGASGGSSTAALDVLQADAAAAAPAASAAPAQQLQVGVLPGGVVDGDGDHHGFDGEVPEDELAQHLFVPMVQQRPQHQPHQQLAIRQAVAAAAAQAGAQEQLPAWPHQDAATAAALAAVLASAAGQPAGDLGVRASGSAAAASAAAAPSRCGHRALLLQQLSGLAAVLLRGFPEPNLEASYLVYKNHSCALLDATASIICSGMLLASAARSLHPDDPLAWHKLGVLLAYGLAFFFPYALMQARRTLFLARREVLLVGARWASAALLCLVALGWVPQPEAWVNAVTKTLSLQLQNAFILPSCQQLRLPAAAAIAVGHVPSDALMLALRLPPWLAVLQACLMAACSMAVALALDCRCRWKFIVAYPGATGSAAGGARFGGGGSTLVNNTGSQRREALPHTKQA